MNEGKVRALADVAEEARQGRCGEQEGDGGGNYVEQQDEEIEDI